MAIDTNKDMRWMTNNFLESGLNSFTVSSENTYYPFTNLTDYNQRAKTFKFGGRFLIEEDVNDKFYIDYLGTPSVYQVPADDYATLDDLLTAIFAASSSVYEFSYDGDTNVIGVSAAIPFTLQLSLTTESIWETIGYTNGVDQSILASAVYEADEARFHWPYEEINVDFGYQAPIGFVGFIGDLAEEFKIPEGAVVRFMGNTIDDFTSPPLDKNLVWTDTGIFEFMDDIDDSAWRYIKITIACPSGPFYPEFGCLYIGDYTTLDGRNISTGVEMDLIDPSEQSLSEGGQLFTNDKTPFREFSSLDIGLASPEHVAFFKALYKLKQKSVPFFVSLDPTEFLSDSPDEYLAYVRFPESPKYKHILNNRFEVSFFLREAL
jgi:hypothetical protein